MQNHKHFDDYAIETHPSDYAYAYYEPGAPMKHQNIPADYYEEAGSSSILRERAPNSIRALLLAARKNNMQRKNSSYSQSDGSQLAQQSQENVYEEIRETEKKNMLRNDSTASLNQSLVEEEFRRVHNRHQRVLGELNLSVEEMLMPPQPNKFIQAVAPMSDIHVEPMDFLGNGEVTDGLYGAGNCNNNLDLDSGFSGSNSSYIGSLRYQKSLPAAGYLAKNSPKVEPIYDHDHSDCGSSFYGCATAPTSDKIGIKSVPLSSRSASSLYDSKISKQTPSQSAQRNNKMPFWKGKGWKNKKLDFSSTSSVNKIGIGKLNRIETNCV